MGDGMAQVMLAHMYDTGRCVNQDHKQAVNWFRQAAEQGHAGAITALENLQVK